MYPAGSKRTAPDSSSGSDGGGKPPADGNKVSPVIKRHKTMDKNDCPEEFFLLPTQNLENIWLSPLILRKQFIEHTIASQNADKILDIVKDDFKLLSDEQIYNLLKRNDLDKKKHKNIKETLWSWSHLMEHNDEKLAKITKGEDIKVVSMDDSLLFHERFNTGNIYNKSMFCCSNNYIFLISDEMLDKALTMKSLSPKDLGFIFDNYITGQGGIDNLGVTFDTLERRNQAFQHKIGAEEIVSFVTDTTHRYQLGHYSLPEDYTKHNSIQRMIDKDLDDPDVKNFISPKSAKIAYNIIMTQQDFQGEDFGESIICSPYIFTHREVIQPEHEKMIADTLYGDLTTDTTITKRYRKMIAQRLKDLPKVISHLNSEQKQLVLTELHSDE